MSIPSAVFIDTSIFDGQQYNFSSIAFTTFVPIADKLKLKLLIPDPTEREIMRHMNDLSAEAIEALEQARRKNPFLSKLHNFPPRMAVEQALGDLQRLVNNEWCEFLRHFEITRLTYRDIDVADVMDWYDNAAAPFGEGKKRREFPDALAIAILDAYSTYQGTPIAVVSADRDFKIACERFSSLLYFPSLPSLTELLLADPDKIAALRRAVETDLSIIENAAVVAVARLDYFHSDSAYEIIDTRLSDVSIESVNIVAIGNNECTLTFEAELESEHLLRWREWTAIDDYAFPEHWVINHAELLGTAKVELDENTQKISKLTLLEFNLPAIDVVARPMGH